MRRPYQSWCGLRGLLPPADVKGAVASWPAGWGTLGGAVLCTMVNRNSWCKGVASVPLYTYGFIRVPKPLHTETDRVAFMYRSVYPKRDTTSLDEVT
jgi:hypothetical protein